MTSILTQKAPSPTHLNLSYAYYASAQIQEITNGLNNLKSEKYEYDQLSRLFRAQRGPDANIQRKYEYDYDRYGNRWEQRVVAGSGYQSLPIFNSADNRDVSPGFTYDGSGNLTFGGNLIYNLENLLTTLWQTASYVPDAQSRRVRKTYNGTTTEYFYSGSEIISEKTGSTWTDYIFFGDQRIARQTGSSLSTTTFLHTDHLGSTRLCTDSNGNSAGTCDYEPFGEFQPGTTCSVPTNFLFAGMQFDGETGAYHTQFRQYYPGQGHWTGVDALPGSAGDPQSLNRYPYVLNDPVNLTDPLGLWPGDAACSVDGISMSCTEAFALVGIRSSMDLFRIAFEITGWRERWDPPNCPDDNCRLIREPIYGNIGLLRFAGLFDKGDPPSDGGDVLAQLGELLKSNRREGEDFKTCVFRNTNEATFGTHKAVIGALIAASTAAITNAARQPMAGQSVSVTAHIGRFVGSGFFLLTAGTISGIPVMRFTANAIGSLGRAAPGFVAAEAGLLIGSAINCR